MAKQVDAKKVRASKVTEEERLRMIAEAAYHRAQGRGFAGGNPDEDWLAAEAQIDAKLNGEKGKASKAKTGAKAASGTKAKTGAKATSGTKAKSAAKPASETKVKSGGKAKTSAKAKSAK